MFLVRLENFPRLSNAVFQFCQIANDADVKFSPLLFTLTASNRSLRFVAVLHIWEHFFAEYSVDQTVSSRISLQSFHNAMWDAGSYSSMTILMQQARRRMVLRFQNSDEDAPPWQRALRLLPSAEGDLDEIERGKHFLIRSEDFRRIIREASPFPNDSTSVTLSHSQVKFSVASNEIILPIEAGGCHIVGYEEGDTTQFRINLHPMNFFLRVSYQAETLWFYKTMDGSHYVISIPTFGFNAECLIYFPQT